MTQPRLVTLALLGFAFLFFVVRCFYTVSETQQALLLQFGEVKSVAQKPGLYVKLPEPLQNVIYIEDRLMPLQTPELEIADADQRRFTVDAFARWRVTNPLRFYQTVQGNILTAERRLDGFLQGSLRKVIGQRPFSDVLSTKRSEIMNLIEQDFAPAARQLGVELVDVRIRRADQPDDITARTFERMKSDRQREATDLRARGQEEARKISAEAENQAVVTRAEANRQSEILRGQGDAQRNRIFAEATSADPSFFAFYRSMRAYENALANKDTTFLITPENEFLRFFSTTTRAP